MGLNHLISSSKMSSLQLAVAAAVADMETTVESSGHATDQESPSACEDNCLMTRESSSYLEYGHFRVRRRPSGECSSGQAAGNTLKK